MKLQQKMHNAKLLPTTLFCICLFLLTPSPLWAVQGHGGAEGLISHQLGHILFIIGMISLLFHFFRHHEKRPGWVVFNCFLLLIILWNCITFYNHWRYELVTENFSDFPIRTFADLLFFLSSLDHLVLIPAFLCLLIALRKWSRQ